MKDVLESESVENARGRISGIKFVPKDIVDEKSPPCFACFGKTGEFGTHSLIGVTSDWKDAEEIVRVCRFGAEKFTPMGGPHPIMVKIGCCDRHLPHLKLLRQITEKCLDINSTLISQVRWALTHLDFELHVRLRAFEIWKKKEPERTLQNWHEAVRQLHYELARSPREDEIRVRALLLWKIIQPIQARNDWLEAERLIMDNYLVVD